MRVERHHIKPTQQIIDLCSKSKDLYNRCNFMIRQAWFAKQPLPDINHLWSQVKDLDCCKNFHNTKTSKQTIRKCLTDWTNFKKARNAFFKDKSKFKRCPKPPKYKEKLAQVIFYSETIKMKPLKDGFIVPTNDCFKIKSKRKFKQVVISPKTFGFVVEVQYEETESKQKFNKKQICSIDVGLNNLCSITSDQHNPILINGRIVKSINQWYNKKKSKIASRKRYFRLENYFHHVSKMIVANCAKHNVGTIIIGKNDGWKQNINLGKHNNQNFCSVPFYKLFEKIKYKAEELGIDVIFTEEAYTSKASFIDRDEIPEYKKGIKHIFSGKRKHRGLYISKDGFALNADINGSLNIARKVISEFERIGNRSIAAMPVIVNPLRFFC